MFDTRWIDYCMDSLIDRYPTLSSVRGNISTSARILIEAYQAEGKLLVCGNGGSAADADHIVGELMKGFVMPRPVSREFRERLAEVEPEIGERIADALQSALPAIALTQHNALVTAFSNDVDPSMIFAQQVAGYGVAGDVYLGITTSGNSRNVIYGAITARARGLRVIGLTGAGGGALAKYCDVCMAVPEKETYKVQELHLPVYHALCLAIEKTMFS